MLKINHIYVEFASKVVFNDATFIAHPNEITVFIGESGTGKTTLFQCILLRLSKDSEYYFYHTKIHELDEKEKEEYLLDCISYLRKILSSLLI